MKPLLCCSPVWAFWHFQENRWLEIGCWSSSAPWPIVSPPRDASCPGKPPAPTRPFVTTYISNECAPSLVWLLMGHNLTQTLPSAGGACPFSCFVVRWTAVKTQSNFSSPFPGTSHLLHLGPSGSNLFFPPFHFVLLQSHVWLSASPLDCTPRLLCLWIFRILEWGLHLLLHGIFWTQGSNVHLLHWQADSLLLSHQGSPLPTLYLLFIRCLFCSKAPDVQDLSPSATLSNPVTDTAGGGSGHLVQEVARKEQHLGTALSSCIAHHTPHITGPWSTYFVSVFPTRLWGPLPYLFIITCLHPTHPAPRLAHSINEVYQRTRWEIEWKLDQFPRSLTVRTESARKTKIQFHEINIKCAGIIFCYSGLVLVRGFVNRTLPSPRAKFTYRSQTKTQ